MEKDPDLIAPCGMNCAICSAFLARARGVKEYGIQIPYCAGCRPRNKQCAFLKKRCHLIREGTVRFCFACPQYPCDRLKKIDRRYRERYRMSMLLNLTKIQQRGIEAFLQSEDEKSKCSDCGGTICCHNGICFDCGLEQLSARKQRFRWAVE
jgi:Protein of unknown function (DUF3795)